MTRNERPDANRNSSIAIRNSAGPRPLLVFAGAALIALALYLPTLQYDFVWDDSVLIQKNSFLDQTNPVELFTKGFWHNPEMNRDQGDMAYYRPLTNLSFFFERKEWGLRPTGYHLTNVIINAAVVFLMCLVLFQLFGEPSDSTQRHKDTKKNPEKRTIENRGDSPKLRLPPTVWLAGLGGLLVGIHPAMNCVVTFISNRTYLLALFFLLVSCYALLRGSNARNQATREPRNQGKPPEPPNPRTPEPSFRLWRALFAGSFLLSLLALEAALVFAAIAAGWLWMNRARYRNVRVWLALTALPVAVYFVLRLGIARVPFASSVVRWAINDPLRVINTFGQQLQLLFFPFNHKVIYVVGEPFSGFSVYTILGLLFLGLPVYAIIRLRNPTRRHKDTKKNSDRRTTENTEGTEGNLDSTQRHEDTKNRENPEQTAKTQRPPRESNPENAPPRTPGPQGESSPESTQRHARGETPKCRNTEIPKGNDAYRLSPTAYRLSWLGYAWMVLFLLPFAHLVFLGPAGRILYLTAPGVLILLAALGRSLKVGESKGLKVRESGSQKDLRTFRLFDFSTLVRIAILVYVAAFAVQALRRNPIWRSEFSLSEAMVREAPESAGGHLNYGSALLSAGRKEEAIEQFRAAVEINPDYVGPHDQLAFALIDREDLPGAITELREVVRLQPESPDARNNLALALKRNGQLDSAIVEYKEAIQLDPNSELALNNLGSAFLARGDFRQAIATLKAALRLKPGFAGARSNLAEAYRAAGMPDSAAMVEK